MKINAITVEIAKLSLNKGDILVLKTDFVLTDEQRIDISGQFKAMVTDGVKIAILQPGMDFQVIIQT
jgi:hypothetical protein